MNKKTILVLFSIIAAFFNYQGSAWAFEKGLLMYLPFEGESANAITSEAGEAKNVIFKEGRQGQGAYFGLHSYLRFKAYGNINYRSGTVEFWVKPSWRGDDGGYHYFFAGNITDARNVNSIHLSKKYYQGGMILGQIDGKADETGRVIDEASVPGGPSLNATSIANWKPSVWHHLAFSWDDQVHTLKLYIDGFLRATNNRVPENAFPSAYQSYINIGSSIDQVVFAEAVIDELKIWNYPKTDLEIAQAAGVSLIDQDIKLQSINQQAGSHTTSQPLMMLIVVTPGILIGLFLMLRRKYKVKANL